MERHVTYAAPSIDAIVSPEPFCIVENNYRTALRYDIAGQFSLRTLGLIYQLIDFDMELASCSPILTTKIRYTEDAFMKCYHGIKLMRRMPQLDEKWFRRHGRQLLDRMTSLLWYREALIEEQRWLDPREGIFVKHDLIARQYS